MSREPATISLLNRLRSGGQPDLPDAVVALAIGGSHARGKADDASDLDLYVIVRGESLNDISDAAPILQGWAGEPMLSRGPVDLPHFGSSMTLIYEDLSVVQFHINLRSTIEINPMRATSEIIHDPSGILASIKVAAGNLEPDLNEIEDVELTFITARIVFVLMAIKRGELWRAIGYLADIRVSMFKLHRIQQNAFRPGIATDPPAGRLELEVADSIKFSFTISAYELIGIAQSLFQCMNWTDEYVSWTERPEFFTAVSRTISRARDEVQKYL
jgi:hypothetical protein